MTPKPHGTRYVHNGGTRQAFTPVRVVPDKRRRLGWCECPVDEFLHLLAQHEAGKINLLDMPETSADPIDDEPEEEETPQAQGKRKRGRGVLPALLDVMRQVRRPLTWDQLGEITGFDAYSIRTVLYREKKLFMRTGTMVDGRSAWVMRTEEKTNGISE